MHTSSDFLTHLTVEYNDDPPDVIDDFLHALYQPRDSLALVREKFEYHDPPFFIDTQTQMVRASTSRSLFLSRKRPRREDLPDQYIDFRNRGITSFDEIDVDTSKCLMLDASINQINDLSSFKIRLYPKLKHLYFQRNCLTEFSNVPSKLQELDFSNNKISFFGVNSLLKDMESLRLDSNELHNFKNFPFFWKLKTLDIRNNPLCRFKSYQILLFLLIPTLEKLNGRLYSKSDKRSLLKLFKFKKRISDRVCHALRMGLFPENLNSLRRNSNAFLREKQNNAINNKDFKVIIFDVCKHPRKGVIHIEMIVDCTKFLQNRVLNLVPGFKIHRFFCRCPHSVGVVWLFINGERVEMTKDSKDPLSFYCSLILSEGNYSYWYSYKNSVKEVRSVKIKAFKKKSFTRKRVGKGVQKNKFRMEVLWSTIDGSRISLQGMDSKEYILQGKDLGKTLKASVNFVTLEKDDAKLDFQRYLRNEKKVFSRDLFDVFYVPQNSWKLGYIIRKHMLDFANEKLVDMTLKAFLYNVLPGLEEEMSSDEDRFSLLGDLFGAGRKINIILRELKSILGVECCVLEEDSRKTRSIESELHDLRKIILEVYENFQNSVEYYNEKNLKIMQKMLKFSELGVLVNVMKFQMKLNFLLKKWDKETFSNVIVFFPNNINVRVVKEKFSKILDFQKNFIGTSADWGIDPYPDVSEAYEEISFQGRFPSSEKFLRKKPELISKVEEKNNFYQDSENVLGKKTQIILKKKKRRKGRINEEQIGNVGDSPPRKHILFSKNKFFLL